MLAIAAEMDWEVHQLDVKTAFLYANIEEEVFVAEPTGFETDDKKKGLLVMKLGKASMGWLKALGIGFIPLIAFSSKSDLFLKPDTCTYIYNHDGVIIILTLYVDNVFVIGGDI